MRGEGLLHPVAGNQTTEQERPKGDGKQLEGWKDMYMGAEREWWWPTGKEGALNL